MRLFPQCVPVYGLPVIVVDRHEKVFHDRSFGDRLRLLRYDRDLIAFGDDRRKGTERFSVYHDLAAARLNDAGQDADKRGFSRTVLADQSVVNFSSFHAEINIIERYRSGVQFCDPAHLQDSFSGCVTGRVFSHIISSFLSEMPAAIRQRIIAKEDHSSTRSLTESRCAIRPSSWAKRMQGSAMFLQPSSDTN